MKFQVYLGLAVVFLVGSTGISAQTSGPAKGYFALETIDLASETEWQASIDGQDYRSIQVPFGGWNSDQQDPQIHTMDGVDDHVIYRRKIQIPRVQDKQVTKILFGAVNYGAEVFIDDQLVGGHEGSFMPFEVDLSNHVKPGKNYTLKVKAYHRRHYYSEENPRSCMLPVGFDFPEHSKHWNGWSGNTKFGYGIVKYIKLAIYPEVYLKDIFIKTMVNRDSLLVHYFIHNTSDKTRTINIESGLTSWNKHPWTYPDIEDLNCTIAANSVQNCTLTSKWGLPPESYWWPNLPFMEKYRAQLHFLNINIKENNRDLCSAQQRFGFHEYTEGPFYYLVNNVRVTGIGDGTTEAQISEYDAYSTSPAFLPPTDHTLGCPETWRRYQRIGINCIRVCNSMPTEYMFETADEQGFMLVPEPPIWGNEVSIYHPVYTPESIREMARYCRNHPSVVRYSLTNETRTWDKDPWHTLIDAIREEDDTRPLVYELHNYGVGKIEGEKGGHAFIMEHYNPYVRQVHYNTIKKSAGSEFIIGEGEFAWGADKLAEFALKSRAYRWNDYAYFAPWSWINYWPNFLEGMNHEKHAWKPDNGPDRVDNINGWNSPIVLFTQKSLHPYLLICHEVERANNLSLFEDREYGDGSMDWPKEIIEWKSGTRQHQTIEIFNGGLEEQDFQIAWELRWDSNDGDLAGSGKTETLTIEAGFHQPSRISLEIPETDESNRKLFLVMHSLADGVEVFKEDQIYYHISK